MITSTHDIDEKQVKIHYLKRFVIYQVIIFVVALVPSLFFPYQSLSDFAMSLLLVGAVVLGIGAYGQMGAWGTSRSGAHVYARSVSEQSFEQETRRVMETGEHAYTDMIRVLPIGIFPIVVAILIDIVL